MFNGGQMTTKNLNCQVCAGKCNKKGYPSVSKYSHYCNDQRRVLTVEQAWGFAKYWNKLLMLKTRIGQKLRGFR